MDRFTPVLLLAIALIGCPTLDQQATANSQITGNLADEPLPNHAIARLGTRRFRFHDTIGVFILSPDGKVGAFVGLDRLALWDIETGRQQVLASVAGPFDSLREQYTAGFRHAAFSPDSQWLAAVQAGNCRVWSTQDGMEQSAVVAPEGYKLLQIDFKKTGELVGFAVVEKKLHVMNLQTREELSVIPDVASLQHAEFSRRGDQLLLQCRRDEANYAILWDLGSSRENASKKMSSPDEAIVGFSDTGTAVSTSAHAQRLGGRWSGTHVVLLRETFSGKFLQETIEQDDHDMSGSHDAKCIGVSRDADLMATTTVPYWQSESAVSTVRVRKLSNGNELLKVEVPRGLAGKAQFSSDGRIVAITQGQPRWRDDFQFQSVDVFEIPSGRSRLPLDGHIAAVASLSFSPDGQTLASTGFDRTVRLWNVGDGTQIANLTDSLPNGNSVAFSPNGKLLAATGGWHHSPRVIVWDVANRQPKYWLPVPDMETIAAIAFSPDGTHMVSGAIAYSGGFNIVINPDDPPRDFGTIELWDIERFDQYLFRRKPEFHTRPRDFQLRGKLSEFDATVMTVAISPDGRLLAAGGWNSLVNGVTGGFISLWAVPSGELVRTIGPLDSVIGQLAFSPDGQSLATVGSRKTLDRTKHRFLNGPTVDERTIQVWDVQAGNLRCKLEGHDRDVTSVTYSPDGRFLASGSLDKTVRLWEVSSQRLVATLKGHDSAVLSVAFAPDGKALASGSSDTTILVWDVAAAAADRN